MNGLARLAFPLFAVLLSAGEVFADLTAARAEPNLEKRARKALDNAETMLRSAQKSYRSGDWDATQVCLDEVRESVELAFESLKETGKDPRKRPKHFKRAEIKTRKLLRKLGDFRQKMTLAEREQTQPIQAYIQQVHDEILEGVLGTGKW